MPIDPVSIAATTLAMLASGDVIRSVTPWVSRASRVSPATVERLLHSGGVLLPPVLQISPQQIQRALRSGTLDAVTTRELRLLQQQNLEQHTNTHAHAVEVELELHRLKLAIERADTGGAAAITPANDFSPPAPPIPVAMIPLADLTSVLRELAQLHRDGLMTESEFAPLRASILDSIRRQLGVRMTSNAAQDADTSALSGTLQELP